MGQEDCSRTPQKMQLVDGFRKHGIGKKLMERASLWAIQNDATEIQLNTYFKDAHDFFLACGFEDVSVIPNWKYGLDCYLMRRGV